jgi:hypothetical protein
MKLYRKILPYFKFIKADKFLMLLFTLFTILMSCDIDNHKLSLINNTDKSYYYRLLADTTDLKEGLYIDTISAHNSVKPLFVRGGDGAWEYKINHDSPDSTLNIYLFENAKLTDDIIIQRKFKKLTYKVKDLEKLKWKVIIPE